MRDDWRSGGWDDCVLKGWEEGGNGGDCEEDRVGESILAVGHGEKVWVVFGELTL